MQRSSLTEYLTEFHRRGDECAYVQARGYRTERWSYRQTAELAFRFARELESRGIGKADHVVFWGENSAQWVSGFFGCALRGAIVVPIDDSATAQFAERVAQQVKARLVLCSTRHFDAMDAWPRIALSELADTLEHRSAAAYSEVTTERQDVLEVVFTSGTTAEPKGVVITHGNVLANVEPLEKQILDYLKYERFVHPVRFLNLLPLSHVFGQFMGIFLPQLMSGTVLFSETLNPSQVVETIRREGVSVLIAVPRMLQSLKNRAERELQSEGALAKFREKFKHAEGKHFLRRWWIFRRVHRDFGWKFWAFICGGATLDRDTEEFWGRTGYAVVQGYGLTETTSLISVNHPFRLGKGSIGKVLPGREIRLAEDGEILVRGGGVSAQYMSAGTVQPTLDDSGWYHTGDLGELDAAGHLYFKGRKKEVIVTSAGMNVYPADLEAALKRQPEVKDCSVIGLEREGNAQPCAVLILKDSAVAGEVVQRANQGLAEYQQMNFWYVWPDEDFPRTSTQKPRSNIIREVVQSRLNGDARRVQEEVSPMMDLIRQVGGRSSGRRAESPGSAELNLSSLERVELMSAIEDRYQIDLSEVKFASAKSADDLEKIVRGELGQRTEYHYPEWTLSWPIRWVRLAAYYLLIRPAVFLLGWPRVAGRENLRGERGPFLVVSNHIDDVDPGFILTALPLRIRHRLATATGGEALELLRTPDTAKNVFGRLLDRVEWILGVALLNLFPLPRAAGFRKSFAYAGRAVDRGYSILVFPEGHHTTDGKLKGFLPGIGLLALNLKIPVLPMRIDGLYEIKAAGKKFALPGKIRVRLGTPMRFSESVEATWIADELRSKVEELGNSK